MDKVEMWQYGVRCILTSHKPEGEKWEEWKEEFAQGEGN